jgi:hypothetical protein
MNGERPWPPLIIAGHLPLVVKWRDRALTLMAWGLFGLLLAIELPPVFHALAAIGLGHFGVHAPERAYFGRLAPFGMTSAALIAMLVVFSLRTLERRARGLLLPQPPPLETADQAGEAGLQEFELIAARDQRIVVAYVDATGVRIEAKVAVIADEASPSVASPPSAGRPRPS